MQELGGTDAGNAIHIGALKVVDTHNNSYMDGLAPDVTLIMPDHDLTPLAPVLVVELQVYLNSKP